MDVKNSFAVAAALLAFGVGGPAIASAADQGNSAPITATDQSTADEQQSGEQGDVQNTDLASQVEEADGANNQDGINQEDVVGDGANGQVDDGPAGN